MTLVLFCFSCFNSRAREGATLEHVGKTVAQRISIHAPVRARHSDILHSVLDNHFNSRAREGATSSRARLMILFGISIHAPVRARP